MAEHKVTPWDVSGKVDYDKLIKEFGVKHITEEMRKHLEKLSKKAGLPFHLYLKRELFFSHRDFDLALKELEKGKEVFLYTGRAPGGSMHVGHSIPFLFTKYLQDIFNCNLYIQIPDDEKFLFKKELTREQVDEMTLSDLEDLAAFGFNPNKTFIFRNTEYIQKMYYLYMKTAKKITFSQARNTFGFTNDSNVGMINYPALQILPTFFEKNLCVIPCAIDQDPYFRLQRDFAESLGYRKNVTVLSKFLTALTGPEGKMSASDPTKAILLSDEATVVKKKINKHAFSGGGETLEEHRKKGGNTEVDVAYQWLFFLFEEDNKKIAEIKKAYESGEMLSGEMKALLIEKVNAFLEEHRRKKEEAKKNKLLDKYMYSGKLAKAMWEKDFSKE
jgi:tryptophanyl-tRNA synthetase